MGNESEARSLRVEELKSQLQPVPEACVKCTFGGAKEPEADVEDASEDAWPDGAREACHLEDAEGVGRVVVESTTEMLEADVEDAPTDAQPDGARRVHHIQNAESVGKVVVETSTKAEDALAPQLQMSLQQDQEYDG